MESKKSIFFYCEVYLTNIYVLPGFSEKEVSEFISTQFEIEYTKEIKSLFGFATHIESEKTGGIVIWLGDMEYSPKLASIIAHESLHAANMILDSAGVGVSLENDEAQAYLAGWIVRKITEFYFSDKQIAKES